MTANRYASRPCHSCGAEVVFITDRDGHTVPLDPTLEVYHRITEPDEGSAFWLRDEAPKGERRQSLARHRCKRP